MDFMFLWLSHCMFEFLALKYLHKQCVVRDHSELYFPALFFCSFHKQFFYHDFFCFTLRNTFQSNTFRECLSIAISQLLSRKKNLPSNFLEFWIPSKVEQKLLISVIMATNLMENVKSIIPRCAIVKLLELLLYFD